MVLQSSTLASSRVAAAEESTTKMIPSVHLGSMGGFNPFYCNLF